MVGNSTAQCPELKFCGDAAAPQGAAEFSRHNTSAWSTEPRTEGPWVRRLWPRGAGSDGGSLRTQGQRGQEAAVTHDLVPPAACLTCDVLTRSSCPQSREHPRPTQAAAGWGRGRGRDRDRAPGDAAAGAGARTGPLDSGSLLWGVAAVGGAVQGAGWLPPLPTALHLSSRPGCRWSCGRPSPPPQPGGPRPLRTGLG